MSPEKLLMLLGCGDRKRKGEPVKLVAQNQSWHQRKLNDSGALCTHRSACHCEACCNHEMNMTFTRMFFIPLMNFFLLQSDTSGARGKISPTLVFSTVWYLTFIVHVCPWEGAQGIFQHVISFIPLETLIKEQWMVRVMNIAFKEGLTIRYISLPWSHPESEQRVSLPFTLTPESHSSTICVRFLILFCSHLRAYLVN